MKRSVHCTSVIPFRISGGTFLNVSINSRKAVSDNVSASIESKKLFMCFLLNDSIGLAGIDGP